MSMPSWMQIGITLLIVFLLSIPAGRYLCAVVTERRTLLDPLFDRVDNAIYLLIGRRAASRPMNWRAFTFHMLATNLVMAVIIYLILVLQDRLPLNPKNFPAMEPMLAFNTAISFITNTDWQGYAGETTLSNFSQMAAITFPMFTSAATGFVVAMAFIRAFIVKDGGANLGNFYRDLIRFTTRVLLPISLVLSLFLISQGSPQTLYVEVIAHPIQGGEQGIAIGSVAALETIKHIGTNGGGFFNANAAHPFENPTPLTSLLLGVSMALLPSALVICFGEMIGNRRQACVLYGVMAAMVVMFARRQPRCSSRAARRSWRRTGSSCRRAAINRVAIWKARRPASVLPAAASLLSSRRPSRPAASTRCMTASRRSAHCPPSWA